MKKEFGQAIKEFRGKKKFTQEQLGELIGVDKGNISRYESGQQFPDFDRLITLADSLDIKISELFVRAEGLNMGNVFERNTNEIVLNHDNVIDAPEVSRVPIISWVQAGQWQETFENSNLEELEYIETTYKAKQYTFALRVVGDSMEPKFPEGCIIIVEPSQDPANKSYVIVRQDGNKATFKQYIEDGDEKYLKPLNEKYPLMPLKMDAAFCGVVKKLEMDV